MREQLNGQSSELCRILLCILPVQPRSPLICWHPGVPGLQQVQRAAALRVHACMLKARRRPAGRASRPAVLARGHTRPPLRLAAPPTWGRANRCMLWSFWSHLRTQGESVVVRHGAAAGRAACRAPPRCNPQEPRFAWHSCWQPQPQRRSPVRLAGLGLVAGHHDAVVVDPAGEIVREANMEETGGGIGAAGGLASGRPRLRGPA